MAKREQNDLPMAQVVAPATETDQVDAPAKKTVNHMSRLAQYLQYPQAWKQLIVPQTVSKDFLVQLPANDQAFYQTVNALTAIARAITLGQLQIALGKNSSSLCPHLHGFLKKISYAGENNLRDTPILTLIARVNRHEPCYEPANKQNAALAVNEQNAALAVKNSLERMSYWLSLPASWKQTGSIVCDSRTNPELLSKKAKKEHLQRLVFFGVISYAELMAHSRRARTLDTRIERITQANRPIPENHVNALKTTSIADLQQHFKQLADTEKKLIETLNEAYARPNVMKQKNRDIRLVAVCTAFPVAIAATITGAVFSILTQIATPALTMLTLATMFAIAASIALMVGMGFMAHDYRPIVSRSTVFKQVREKESALHSFLQSPERKHAKKAERHLKRFITHNTDKISSNLTEKPAPILQSIMYANATLAEQVDWPNNGGPEPVRDSSVASI